MYSGIDNVIFVHSSK